MKKIISLLLSCIFLFTVARAGTGMDDYTQAEIDSVIADVVAKKNVERIAEKKEAVPVIEVVTDEVCEIPDVKKTIVAIPDSLLPEVQKLLRGYHKVIRDDDQVEVDELALYKGDTIPMVLKDLKLGRYDRGLFNFLFIPKGMWIFGLTASYGKFTTQDMQLFDVISDTDLSAHGFSIKPYFSYAFKNNVTAGLRLEYSNLVGNIDNFGLDIDEDMNFNIHDVGYRSESYSAALLLTQYIGLYRKGRFGVFNEAQLKFTSGSSDFNRPFDGEMKNTHSSNFEASLTYSPGLCVYIMPQVSANLSFGVFGFYINHTRQWENGVRMGSRTTSGANFRFNIFNISFGLAVHI